MKGDGFPLFDWKRPCEVVPFPSLSRIGHARKVAGQMARARSQREAEYVLARALSSHREQMTRAGISSIEMARQEADLRGLIYRECLLARAPWTPVLIGGGNDGGGL